ncbi:uncharacterized protein N7506_007456 [Penicillium brevicompactum]|uniref:uncharacterized protein n=1 Tax=Penicillium brevicompactum TaxID=5074 RepID=UPI002540B2C3|nr:uncharacterized protein N7506_007456 [Penicillium brevicompactum]KAJ5333673.1 hypothetical protein N7506_007456 [Penicillium brevicompactum]
MLAALHFGVTTPGPPKVELKLQTTWSEDRFYTTSDHIEGFVSIETTSDVPLGKLTVTLQGRTALEGPEELIICITKVSVGTSSIGIGQAISSRSRCQQIFLRVSQMIDPMQHAVLKTQKSHYKYCCPFSLEVPEKIHPQVCRHRTQSLAVYESHTRIPPTLGSGNVEFSGQSALTDTLSDTAEVAYTLHASLFAPLSGRNSQPIISTQMKGIKILPSFHQEPPREGFGSELYCTSKEKNLKHGIWNRQIGRLTISASQPEPLNSSHIILSEEHNPDTTTVIDLNFDQEGTTKPPLLCSLTTRLSAVTLYGAVPWESYPDLLVGKISFADYGRGMDWKVMPLSKMCVESVRWIEKPAYSSCEQPSAPHLANYDKPATSTQHTASIVVPITIPNNHHLVPTFHSCLISRVYLLEFSLSYKQSDAQILTSSLSLRVPVQVIA